MLTISRPPWQERTQRAWAERHVVWLSGLRRGGKTTLARILPEAVHLNCDLPAPSARSVYPNNRSSQRTGISGPAWSCGNSGWSALMITFRSIRVTTEGTSRIALRRCTYQS